MTEPEHIPAYETVDPGAIEFFDLPPYTFEEASMLIHGVSPERVEKLARERTRVTGTSPALTAASDGAQTGAMIAFLIADDDVQRFVIAGGEPPEELHVTAAYLGDAASFDEHDRVDITDIVEEFATRQPMFIANAFALSVFNPNGDEPCLVAGLSGDALEDAHDGLTATLDESYVEIPEEAHRPWIPHMTLIYAADPELFITPQLKEVMGPVIIDRIRVVFAGEVRDFELTGALTSSLAFHLPGHHDQLAHGRGGVQLDERGIPVGFDVSGMSGGSWQGADDPLVPEMAQIAQRHGFTSMRLMDDHGTAAVSVHEPDVLQVGIHSRKTWSDIDVWREHAKASMPEALSASSPATYLIAHEAGHRHAFTSGTYPHHTATRDALHSYASRNGVKRHKDLTPFEEAQHRRAGTKPPRDTDIERSDLELYTPGGYSNVASQRASFDAFHDAGLMSSYGAGHIEEFVAEAHASFQLGNNSDFIASIAAAEGWSR